MALYPEFGGGRRYSDRSGCHYRPHIYRNALEPDRIVSSFPGLISYIAPLKPMLGTVMSGVARSHPPSGRYPATFPGVQGGRSGNSLAHRCLSYVGTLTNGVAWTSGPAFRGQGRCGRNAWGAPQTCRVHPYRPANNRDRHGRSGALGNSESSSASFSFRTQLPQHLPIERNYLHRIDNKSVAVARVNKHIYFGIAQNVEIHLRPSHFLNKYRVGRVHSNPLPGAFGAIRTSAAACELYASWRLGRARSCL